jgi:hypothetical protein
MGIFRATRRREVKPVEVEFMHRCWMSLGMVGCFAWFLPVALADAHIGGDLARKASWTQPNAADVKARFDEWLAGSSAGAAAKLAAESAWAAAEGMQEGGLLDRTVAALAAADPRVAEVVAACQLERSEAPAVFGWLLDESEPDFVRANMRLFYGRWLTQLAHYDESLEQLTGLTPVQVVDPAGLLFYRAVAQHRLLKKDDCLRSLGQLLENEPQLPRRFRTLARLMEADIKPLEADSLDEVARLMDDIRRRLDFGHAGTRVRKVESDVIAKLDKMIEEMEQQQQQQRQQRRSSGNDQGNIRSSSPAPDSVPLGGRGPGDVDQRKIGDKSGWGDLPPKQREEALQQISKDLPAHFRDVIEEYFRKLARDGGD